MRINKYLAQSGLGSRRKVEKLIIDGLIKVNGNVVTNLATEIDENRDIVQVNDVTVKPTEEKVYYMLNKPKGYVTTVEDDRDRKTVLDLMGNIDKRIFPVGRLDYNTEGLLILTNDGDLAQLLTKPKYAVSKTYSCTIEGTIKESELAVLRNGIVIDGHKLNKCKIKVLNTTSDKTKLQVTINEGKNRQIRKMFEYVNKTVVYLKRISIEDLKLGGLSRGEYRELKDYEIEYLYSLGSNKKA